MAFVEKREAEAGKSQAALEKERDEKRRQTGKQENRVWEPLF